MADVGGLQLLPETRRKIEIVIPGENKLLVAGGFVFAIMVILAGWFYFYGNSIQNKLASTDAEIAGIEQKRDKKAEQNIITFNKQISVLSKQLNDHVYWTTGFSKIEGLTQGQVQFESMTAALSDNKLDFKATAANYTTIARQIAAFLSDESIKDINLSKVSTLTSGRLEFSMQILFDRTKFLKSR